MNRRNKESSHFRRIYRPIGFLALMMQLAVNPGVVHGQTMFNSWGDGSRRGLDEFLTKEGAAMFVANTRKARAGKLRQSDSSDASAPLNLGVLEVTPIGDKFLDLRSPKKGDPTAIVMYTAVEKETGAWGIVRGDRKRLNRLNFGEVLSAQYLPDSRGILMGRADSIIMEVRGKKFTPVDAFRVDLKPAGMQLSGNGYYLALTDGSEAAVYNFEDHSLRCRWQFDAPVTGMRFNPDDTELAIMTADGYVSIYDTRNFLIKTDRDGMGQGLAMDYNSDGKWLAVVTAPDMVRVINRFDRTKDKMVPMGDAEVYNLAFLPDAEGKTLLLLSANQGLVARRIKSLSPYYGKLVRERADAKMNEWLKMMPDETLEGYRARISDESRKRRRRLFEAEAASEIAGDPLAMSTLSLGMYDRSRGLLEINFGNMPSIALPVPEEALPSFADCSDLELRNSRYGVMDDDNFELIYAEVYNKKDGRTYVYDNLDRASLALMDNDENVVSVEVIQQQQMEALKLQELRRIVLEDAKSRSIISDHTNITVDSSIVPDYDASGRNILDYKIRFSYEVEPDFSAHEDFAPGKYHVDESGAASSLLRIVSDAFEGELAKYLCPGKRLIVNISGTADAMPIRSAIPYDGCYGDFGEVPVMQEGERHFISVGKADGITTNEQLAFVRAAGVQHFLNNKIGAIPRMNADYRYNIDVANDRGGEFRRITAEFTFIDVQIDSQK